MADETVNNGDFSNDRTVEITADETSSKLTQKITDLELQNGKIIRETEGYKQEIEELKGSIKILITENVECKNQLEKAESEIKTLRVVAARAAQLETEVSRLQHDMSDLQESSVEMSDLKRELEGVKNREKEKDVKLEVIEKERDLLLAKVEKLEGLESSLRDEADGKEKEIRSLKKKIEELGVIVDSSKGLEKLKYELENVIEKMKGEISILESTLEEKQKVNSGFETTERAVPESFNADAITEGEKKGSIAGLKQKDWVVIGGSSIAAVAVMGVACYVHAARKH